MVRGRVFHSKDETAIHQAEIILLSARKNGEVIDFAGRGMSKMDGSYAIPGLPAGRYRILVTAEGFARTLSPLFELIEEESAADVDILLSPGAGVEVTVTDSQGNPHVGAIVLLKDSQGRLLNEGLAPLTDENGVYRFPSLSERSTDSRDDATA